MLGGIVSTLLNVRQVILQSGETLDSRSSRGLRTLRPRLAEGAGLAMGDWNDVCVLFFHSGVKSTVLTSLVRKQAR